MNKDALKSVGMTNSEVEVYLDLIMNDQSSASEIAERVQIARTYVYDALAHLIQKGIISYVLKNNRKVFQAKDPEKLVEYIEYKEKQLEIQKNEIKNLIPELKKCKVLKSTKPKVEILEGPEGLKTAFNDIVKEGHDILAWGGTRESYKHVPEFVIKKYVREKAEKNIKTTQLYTKGSGTFSGPGYKNIKISREFSAPATVATYGKKTAVFIWAETPVTILIESKEVAESFKKHITFLINKLA
ncbi:MAG: helix-turn-helix domain-containing protein [Candidatus Woesearchaeota archaeon]